MALVNFYKGSYDSEALLNLCKTQGNIVFDNNTSRIYVGTVGEGASEAPKIYGSNVVDATFVNNVLTITRLDGEQPVTLDFSDVASAKSLMAVFDQLKRFMGMSTGSSSEIAPNYSSDSTGILYNTSTSTANAASLVEADLVLAAAIANSDQVDDIQINGTTIISNKVANVAVDGTYNASTNKIATESTVTDVVSGLDAVADADTAGGAGYATVTTTTPSADFKVLNSVTEADGKLTAAEAYQLKKVAATAESSDLFKSTNSTSAYDTTATEISSSWATVVTSNALVDGDTVDADLNKLDNKIAGLADELIRDERVINAGMTAVSDSVGLEDDFSLNFTGTGIIDSDTDVKSALVHLAGAITGMDSTATIASKSGNVVTLKAGLVQTDGVVTNDASADITLASVAATGAASDVALTDTDNHFTADNVEAALAQLATSVESLSGSFDVIIASDAASTPQGVTWDNNGTTVTGTLAASAGTFHKIYFVHGTGGSGKNTCAEYVTTKTTSNNTVTYGWEKLGDIDVDLTGYVKSVTVNGKTYQVDTNSTNITLTDLITAITGETAISGGDSSLVAVTATTTKNTTTGANSTVLASSVKIEEVADGLTEDLTASYTSGHYVIQNGKLVDASNASSGDTYTISANDGLTKASDVKAYVDSAVQNARLTWAQWS